jgi:hypothetical protein
VLRKEFNQIKRKGETILRNAAQRFIRFAEEECHDASPLYEFLSQKTSDDEEMLDLASSAAQSGQPMPNLFFAAVHAVLLTGTDHPLARYYPSLTSEADLPEKSWKAFRDFCEKYQEKIKSIMQTRRVQTNEIRRCAYLYPVFCHIYEKTGKPLSMIEIGTSAGLQLLWDRYAYSYGGTKVFGKTDSPVRIDSEVTGSLSLPDAPPPVAAKTGVDLNVLDVGSEEDRRWLDALIWPEHHERRALFKQASRQMQEEKVSLVEGDGVALLPKLASGMPDTTSLVIFHTHVANQMPEEVKESLLESVSELGRIREVFHVYNNISDRLLHLDAYRPGSTDHQTIGKTDGHGRWFEWTL